MFHTHIIAAVTIALFAAGSASPALNEPDEAKLTRMLHGRLAGKPLDCLTLRYAQSSTVIEGTAIVFETAGTLYVNRPASGAESLSDLRTLFTRSLTGELCRGEAVGLIDTSTGNETGGIILGQFVPYRKKARPAETPHVPATGY
jgi:hypothetical protein